MLQQLYLNEHDNVTTCGAQVPVDGKTRHRTCQDKKDFGIEENERRAGAITINKGEPSECLSGFLKSFSSGKHRKSQKKSCPTLEIKIKLQWFV